MGKLSKLVLASRAMANPHSWGAMARAAVAATRQPEMHCPACGFRGRFQSFGKRNRLSAQCPQCGSLERHRLLALANVDYADRTILHFAPEPPITRIIRRSSPRRYVTAGLDALSAELVLDIERIDEPGNSYDIVIASHILEHVDDVQALAELYRVVRPGGLLVTMVPLVDGWARTFEDRDIVTPRERAAHYGQPDHRRFYGADFRDRIRSAGFTLEEHTAYGRDCATYSLARGEKVFFGRKPVPSDAVNDGERPVVWGGPLA